MKEQFIRFPHTFIYTGFADGAYMNMYCCHCGATYIKGREECPIEPCPAFQIFDVRIKTVREIEIENA